jgi:hypothetical protein
MDQQASKHITPGRPGGYEPRFPERPPSSPVDRTVSIDKNGGIQKREG